MSRLVPVSVLLSELMAVNAMRLPMGGMAASTLAIRDVFCLRPEIQVVWANAVWIVTVVVDLVPVGDGSVSPNLIHQVCGVPLPSLDLDAPALSVVHWPHPGPASIANEEKGQ